MKLIKDMGAQGDVLFLRVVAIPETATQHGVLDEYVVAHSETGHHHVARGCNREVSYYTDKSNPLASYLKFRGGNLPIEHLRNYDTHETVELLDKTTSLLKDLDEVLDVNRFKVIRQRQATPEGWARVTD